MKQKKKQKQRHTISAAVITAAAFLLLFFLFHTKKDTARFPETGTETLTENTRQETEFPKQTKTAADSELTDSADTSQDPAALTTETFLEQQTDRIRSLPAGTLASSGMLAPEQITPLFFASVINDDILTRINGLSYTENPDIALSELSYLKMLYYGFDGNTYVGEMIVNQSIESDILQIFKTLYENKYPIEKMVLIDTYDADDEQSMEDNNTSAFNYRTISGSNTLSNHSYGMAIDLNPKYNPYVKTASDGSIICQPESGQEYADRSRDFAYKIDENDLAYRLFTEAGFTWGGSWNRVKDYQHFEK